MFYRRLYGQCRIEHLSLLTQLKNFRGSVLADYLLAEKAVKKRKRSDNALG